MELTITEQQKLTQYEGVIERGLKTFVDVGNALLAIRDERLYRTEYKNFGEYCLKRWGFTRSKADRLIAATETIKNLTPMGIKNDEDWIAHARKHAEENSLPWPPPINERQIRPLTSLKPDQQREAWQEAKRTAPDGKVTGAHVQKVVDEIKRPNNVHFSSKSPEWHTPSHIIDRVINTFGVIDLDPCSPTTPNVPAVQHFIEEDDGLSQEWFGRVYMNPPYGNEISNWIDHLCQEWEASRISEAIALVPARTDTEWFRKLRQFPRCFVWGRLKFSGHDNSAPFPSMLVYLGQNFERFKQSFSDIGDFYGSI